MSFVSALNANASAVNRKMDQLQSAFSKKEICCYSCPSLIKEIASDFRDIQIDSEDLRKKHPSIIAFKKSLKSTQKRWSALSDRVFLRTPDRCMQNVLNDPMRILKIAYRHLPNLAVLGIGAYYYSPSFGLGCLAGIANYCLNNAIQNRVVKSVRRITKFFKNTLKTINLSKEKPSTV